MQPLGRLGAEVLGIDPVDDSIYTAQMHTSYDPDLRDSVSYQACTIEELSENERNVGHFDAIVASEVVEHVADLDTFIFCCKHVLKACVCVRHCMHPCSASLYVWIYMFEYKLMLCFVS